MRLYPQVGTPKFKRLSFKEQLYVVGMYLYNPEAYAEACGVKSVPDDLKYVEGVLEFLKRQAISVPKIEEDFGVVEGVWTCYRVYYDEDWYAGQLSPVESLGLEHSKVFGLQLFNFPLLKVPTWSLKHITYLREKSGKILSDILYPILTMGVARTLMPTDDPTVLWNQAVAYAKEYFDIRRLLEDYPIMRYSDVLGGIEDGTYALHYTIPRMHGRTTAYIPIVPARLYFQRNFMIYDWGFLEPTIK